ncbi:hypothetical protein QBC38DRAFT_473330 [Podospora fimiseda]|uniref:U6 snRNA-associated Sm-like protein LSm8 n=1 Tax=Podospora fimiseda TaxID=252190 RepID=A0AAN7BT34_9PEZI|nr:hypothetical protein QBC38DRAFT_473330 [Podospora fimiseda]
MLSQSCRSAAPPISIAGPPPQPSSSLINIPQVLSNIIERIIGSLDDNEPSSEVPLGLYLIRGENVCLVGLVDEPLDESINWIEVKGSVIGTTKH